MRERKTFFINRNLFGTYNILVRIKKEIHKEQDNISKKTYKTIQEFYSFNEINQVKKFITENSNSQDIWVY